MPKIVFVCTEDWFFRSHFLPLVRASRYVFEDTVLVTRTGEACQDLARLGVAVKSFDFARSSNGFFKALETLFKLIALLRQERPDLIHLISLKPILVGGLATLFTPHTSVVYHLTGMGFLQARSSRWSKVLREFFLSLIAIFLRRRGSWLIVENEDDMAPLLKRNLSLSKVSVFGGAGIDPNHFHFMAEPANNIVSVAFAGRMVWSKGVDILVDASRHLIDRGMEHDLNLFGDLDQGNPRKIPLKSLKAWNALSHVKWHGFQRDVREIWKRADIAVVPSRGGEGLPKSLLEAASCGRALIVTDVPGCRHFVREGVEGKVVPPEDPVALADAFETLIKNRGLRQRMGQAARKRVLENYTEEHVIQSASKIYDDLIGRGLTWSAAQDRIRGL